MVFKTDYGLMQVKSIAEREHSAILLTFIKLPVVINTFVLSVFEWPFYTGFTVLVRTTFSGHYTKGHNLHSVTYWVTYLVSLELVLG